MSSVFLPLDDFSLPRILAEEKDFLLVYKPPRIHSARGARSSGETLLDWCYARFPRISLLPGRRPGEGGLLHRLDFETQGILLFAKTPLGMESLLAQQAEGKILKGYSALAAERRVPLPGFPSAKPQVPEWVFPGGPCAARPQSGGEGAREKSPAPIESAFRPYGPGRKAVRPVIAGAGKKGKEESAVYLTEILGAGSAPAGGFDALFSFKIGIRKGFRHQIRSHLSWLGLPILNDDLYGGLKAGRGFLALRAFSISFLDPSSGGERDYSIPQLSFDSLV